METDAGFLVDVKSASYVMGQEAADIVYCDGDPADRGPLEILDHRTVQMRLRSVESHRDPDDAEKWLTGYNSRMAELMAND